MLFFGILKSMNTEKYEEDFYETKRRLPVEEVPRMYVWLQDKKIVSTPEQAKLVLLSAIVVLFIVSGILFFSTFTRNSYSPVEIPPELQLQLDNNR